MSMYAYTFPAIRGVQAGRAYFITMCPLRLVPRIFLFDEDELDPELRAQRTLNRARVPEIARYIIENRDSYVFSSITASIDVDVAFEPLGEADKRNIGLLRIPLNAKFIINDGQHRRAAIEAALRDAPELGDETISIVFFVDPGTERAQQMFTDLNRHAVRPPRSLSLLYDHRDLSATLAKEVAKRSLCFQNLVEYERTNLAPRSAKLFTLSAIETANDLLLTEYRAQPLHELTELAVAFWNAVTPHMGDWRLVRERKVSAGEVRRDSIAAHGIALSALAIAGRALIAAYPEDWNTRLAALGRLDWSRANTSTWEGRALAGGKVSKSGTHVKLTAVVLKRVLQLPLSPDEFDLETRRAQG